MVVLLLLLLLLLLVVMMMVVMVKQGMVAILGFFYPSSVCTCQTPSRVPDEDRAAVRGPLHEIRHSDLNFNVHPKAWRGVGGY